jgi:hypothetical protein
LGLGFFNNSYRMRTISLEEAGEVEEMRGRLRNEKDRASI